MQGKTKKRKSSIRTSLAGILLLTLSVILFSVWSSGGKGQSLNVQLTTAAWQALNDRDYEKAVLKARACIGEFQSAADKTQQKLESQGAPSPRTGKPLTEEEKQVILARGLLNDVATSFYIVGRAKENLGHLEDAKQAYRQAGRYSYARTWDPKGWFWSPAESAGVRLEEIEK